MPRGFGGMMDRWRRDGMAAPEFRRPMRPPAPKPVQMDDGGPKPGPAPAPGDDFDSFLGNYFGGEKPPAPGPMASTGPRRGVRRGPEDDGGDIEMDPRRKRARRMAEE